MKKFLLVDDEDIFNYLNAEVIQLVNKNYQHQSYNSGIEALEYITKATYDPQLMPDIILLDIRMPGMNGFDFLDELTKSEVFDQFGLAVYVLSSSLDHRDMDRAKTYSVVKGFYSKPLTEEMVMEMVERGANS
ncbi:MAG: response regulator [Bacteroidota bacterium]